MIETLLITTLIIAICMAFLLVKVLLKRNGEFSSQHIHDSQAMKDRGIHCVMDQDREPSHQESVCCLGEVKIENSKNNN